MRESPTAVQAVTAPESASTDTQDERPRLRFIELHDPHSEAFADDLAGGLQAIPATISPKFLYDELGLRLFWAITELAEYTPTRQEAEIFRTQRRAIAAAIGSRSALSASCGVASAPVRVWGELSRTGVC